MMHQYISGKLVDIITLTPGLKLFYWKADDDAKVDYSFIPGQFAIIHFPALGGSMPYRSYSIAGKKGNVIEFCISLKEDGAATTLLWGMKKGDPLSITEAKGDFILRQPAENEVCFIATGTGVAPFKPMIAQLLLSDPKVHVKLVFGNRYTKDILYHDHWNELALNHPNFSYYPVLSREEWNGSTGYVHECYLPMFKHAPLAQFYICGWKEMISETRRNLKSLGYNRKQYFIESYN